MKNNALLAADASQIKLTTSFSRHASEVTTFCDAPSSMSLLQLSLNHAWRTTSSSSVSYRLFVVCTTVMAFFERFSFFLNTLYCLVYTGIYLIPFHVQITTSNAMSFWSIVLVMRW